MIGRALGEKLRKRKHKRAYRAMIRQWYADGGDEAMRFDYPLGRDALVMDLGGYEGQWASDLYSRYRCRILVFEPVAGFASRIADRFRHNDDIEVFDYGLGAATRTETIHLKGASSSTYRSDAATETIRIADAAEWLQDHAVARVHLMKINIEGGEFELLERLIDAGAVGRIDDIQVQFHNVASDSARRMELIQRKLSETHEPTYQYRFVWENWTRKRADDE
ncbi:MAG: FkbM family methyltransferase [Gammaproteobacteria bacterium]|nr:FkbM family methyltransferase [Gammaproteobacteria bacterium]